MISSNSGTLVSRPLRVIGNSKAWPLGVGGPPILPAAACRFSCWMAMITSDGAIRISAIRLESSQTRMAYLRPNDMTSLTPLIFLRTFAT
jgi:hypothetical protein